MVEEEEFLSNDSKEGMFLWQEVMNLIKVLI